MGDVELHAAHVAADAGCGVGGGVPVQVADHDLRAKRREVDRRLQADAARAAGDRHDGATEIDVGDLGLAHAVTFSRLPGDCTVAGSGIVIS